MRIDERNHVEKPLLDQLEGLGWEIIDLDNKQHPADSHRDSFAEVVMPAVLREQLKVLNTCLEDDQVEEVVRQLSANFPGTGLIENNRHVLNLLLENTNISENRKTGKKSPTVYFVDFKHRDNNRFIAVCQFKVRILGTVNNNVNFNWRLIKAPMFVIDYAIFHELAHMIEANHTPRFWNIIRAQAPTMEKAKAWLKKNGQLLEHAI